MSYNFEVSKSAIVQMKKIGINILNNIESGTGRLQVNLFKQLETLVDDLDLEIYTFTYGTRFPRPNNLPRKFQYQKSLFPGKIQRLLCEKFGIPLERVFRLPKIDWVVDLCLDYFPTEAKRLAYVPDVAWKYFSGDHYNDVFPQSAVERVGKSIHKSEKIITLSYFSKSEICKYYPINNDKCDVLYCGIDPNIYNMDRSIDDKMMIQRFNLPSKYILYVGSLNIRKNPRILSESFRILGDGYSLVHVGPTPKEGYSFWGLDLPNFISLGFVREQELASIYREAVCVVMPSFFEGFGIPLVEGMASGNLVLCSDIPIFHEITGNNALFFNPNDSTTLIKCIKLVYEKNTLNDSIRQNGFKRSREFRWNTFANKFVSLLN